ncbi:MAG: cell division protein FtsI (penicillin-binding protein 3) [Bacteroidia bacterium]|jgi:cell division protein FtsI (penicillin-binding protein 3)
MLTLLGGAIVYSICRVQYAEGEHWRALGDSQHVKFQQIPAVRGSIYSDDGSLLATSVPIYKISLDFKVIKNYHRDSFGRYKKVLAANLNHLLKNRTEAEYQTLLAKGYRDGTRYLTIVRNASFIQTKELQTWPIFNSGRFRGGVFVEERTIRKKPYYGLMKRTIGFINENHKGAGIEASFDDVLSGADGRLVVRRRKGGGYRPLENDMKISAFDGKDVFTTVDIHLQDLVHEALARGITANEAASGTAVLLEVKTGQIKALANIDNTEDGLTERLNHAVGTGYEPGSTMKLVSALASIESGNVDIDDSVDVHYGKFKFFENDSIEDSGHTKVRKMTYQQVFENSSNVGISTIAYNAFRKDPEDFIEYFDQLQLMEPLQTGIKGELVPSILRPNKQGWSGMAIPSISIGYSLKVSPLHVAMLYNAVANNGKMMRPYIISGIGSFGKIETEFEPHVNNKEICKESTLEDLQTILEGVVIRGTASQKLKDLPFDVAGKTGTSRISDDDKGYTSDYHSSFVGYFPVDNPKYTLLVLISRPSKGRIYGSSVALPVFKEIALAIYANAVHKKITLSDSTLIPLLVSGPYKSVKTTCKQLSLPFDTKARNHDFVRLRPENGGLKGEAISFSDNTMPDVAGLGLADCLYLFENKGYKIKHVGYGKVFKQSPLPGSKLVSGRTIYLDLSTKL